MVRYHPVYPVILSEIPSPYLHHLPIPSPQDFFCAEKTQTPSPQACGCISVVAETSFHRCLSGTWFQLNTAAERHFCEALAGIPISHPLKRVVTCRAFSISGAGFSRASRPEDSSGFRHANTGAPMRSGIPATKVPKSNAAHATAGDDGVLLIFLSATVRLCVILLFPSSLPQLGTRPKLRHYIPLSNHLHSQKLDTLF